MKIIPTRTMQLGGKDVLEGVAVDVSPADGAAAIAAGWAVAASGANDAADSDAKKPATGRKGAKA